ncbi:MAG TPA: DNA modification methylase [Microbacterium sp.]|nr:DNA modification methylase [Microbacterium sp.]
MKSRRLTSLALVAAVLAGTSGCSLISPQATLIHYSPADGVGAQTGAVAIRNALFVSDDGRNGNFLAALVNDSEDAQLLKIVVGTGASQSTKTVVIPPFTSVSLGAEPYDGWVGEGFMEGAAPILFTDLDTIPGAMIPVYFQSGDAEGTLVQVPVLTGELEYYEPYVPEELRVIIE